MIFNLFEFFKEKDIDERRGKEWEKRVSIEKRKRFK